MIAKILVTNYIKNDQNIINEQKRPPKHKQTKIKIKNIEYKKTNNKYVMIKKR